MIRIVVEGDKHGLFSEWERLVVCENVLDGEYIIQEQMMRADEILVKWENGWIYDHRPFIFLDPELFGEENRQGVVSATPTREIGSSTGVYRIVNVRKVL